MLPDLQPLPPVPPVDLPILQLSGAVPSPWLASQQLPVPVLLGVGVWTTHLSRHLLPVPGLGAASPPGHPAGHQPPDCCCWSSVLSLAGWNQTQPDILSLEEWEEESS